MRELISVRAMAIVAFSMWLVSPAMAATLLPSGYSENFDSMGALGTAPPSGWRVLSIAGASSTWTNTTGSNSVPAIGAIPNGPAAAGGSVSPALVVSDNPAANQVNGFNALGASGLAGDRGIATAPTGIAGSVIELLLTNGTGASLNSLTVSYDVRRYRVGADAAGRSPPAGIPEGSDELPGYWLMYSLDNGVNFTAVDSLIPVGAGPSSQPIVPNTVGVTSVPYTSFSLGGSWNAGANLVLRWIDDNAIDPSPDEIIGLDNVKVVPEPSTLVCLWAGAVMIGAQVTRRRFRRSA